MTLRQHRKKYDVVNAHTFMLSIALYIVLYIALNFIFFKVIPIIFQAIQNLHGNLKCLRFNNPLFNYPL